MIFFLFPSVQILGLFSSGGLLTSTCYILSLRYQSGISPGLGWERVGTLLTKVIVSIQYEPRRPSHLSLSLTMFWGHLKKSLSCWVPCARQRTSWVITAKCRHSD